ncbi:MAG: DUF3301 domain-containing protein [Pseudomonadota bacterium]|jgi:hypothetical protein|nr:DUF3301 domain-containing protein [Pseudomonadota bacterium]
MYLSLLDVFLIFLFIVFIAVIWQHFKVREHTLRCVKRQCDQLGVQLLDGAIQGSYWRPTFQKGQFKVVRCYRFYFTSTGSGRYRGEIKMRGMQQISIHFDPHPM